MKFLFIISYLFLFISSSILRNTEKLEGVISLEFCVVTQDELLISPIEIGTPFQPMNLVLDIGAERTWISEEIFNKTKSSSYKTQGFIEQKQQDKFLYRGAWSTELIQLSDKKLKDFDFLLVNKIESNDLFQGVLSLGREYDTKKFSIVYRMSAASATFYNSFILKFIDNNKGELYIGDLTKELKDDKTLISSCKLINSKIKWSCMLTHVFVGDYGEQKYVDSYTEEQGYVIKGKHNKIEIIDQPVYFESIYNKIYVPKEFISYLQKNVFINNSNKNELCKCNNNDTKISFTCSKEEMNQINKLNFVFSDKMALTLPNSRLFDCNGDVCEYIIEYNEKYTNGWIMGLPLLRTYQMIFDYNKEDLLFYSNENKAFVQMPSRNENYVLWFFFYLTLFFVVAFVFGVGLIYFLRRKNKKRKYIEEQIYENF